MRSTLSLLGTLGALGLLGVAAEDTGCLDTCNNSAMNNWASFSCTSAQDRACLCANDNFKFSVRDCATGTCGADEGSVQNWLSDGFCSGFSAPEESTVVPTSSGPAVTSTAAEVEPTSNASATKPTATDVTGTVATPRPSSALSEPSEAATTSGGSTTGEPISASKTSEATSSETTAADDEDGAAAGGGGLSQGASVGIGVGVAVCVVAIAVVAIALFLRNRKQKQQHDDNAGPRGSPHSDFAGPIASSGRAFGSPEHDAYEKRGGESIELTSHRYEDMLPRATPRTMV